MTLQDIKAGQVHVWYTFTDPEQSGLLDAYEKLLSPDERALYGRLKGWSSRREFLVARTLIRSTLAEYLEVDARSLLFAKTKFGQPYLITGQSQRGLKFSMSHSYGLVACAVAWNRQIGIDAESALRAPFSDDIARSQLCEEEYNDVARQPSAEEKRRRFLQYWTLKEAYVKARGLGLAIPLEKLSFRIQLGRVGMLIDSSLEDEASAWHVQLLELAPAYCAALACTSSHGPPIVKQTQVTPFQPSSRQI